MPKAILVESPDDDGATAGQVEENGPWSIERSATRTQAIAPDTPAFEAFEANLAATPPVRGWIRDVSSITIRWTAPVIGRWRRHHQLPD